MNSKISSELGFPSLLLERSTSIFIIIGVIAMCYGFEIFNFHLTIDEELFAYKYSPASIAQVTLNDNRWGQYLISLFIPPNIVPTFGIFVGVVLIAISSWLLATKIFHFDYVISCLSVCIAISFPTLAFILSFSWLGYCIGIAFLSLYLYCDFILRENKYLNLISIIIGGFAISIYQSFLFNIAVLSLILVITQKRNYKFLIKIFTSLVASVILYYVVAYFMRYLFDIEDRSYLNNYLDIKGFFGDIVNRLLTASKRVLDVVLLKEYLFAFRVWPWFGITITLFGVNVLFKIFLNRKNEIFFDILIFILILLIPVFADALSPVGAPIRSQVYWPTLILVISGYSLSIANIWIKYLILVTSTLTILGNSIIVNNLFNASELAFDFDKRIAHEILREFRKNDLKKRSDFYKIEVIGSLPSPESKIKPKRETVGASFYEWESGNRYRIASFLNLMGLQVIGVSQDERAQIIPIAKSMPSWPTDGWVKILDNNIVLIKFDNYTPAQMGSLKQSSNVNESDIYGKYPSSLRDGILFNRSGIPEFLDSLNGFTNSASWGRWTSSKISKLYFVKPLPRRFTLNIECCAHEENSKFPIKIKIGEQEKEFIAPKCWEKIGSYELDFDLSSEEKIIDIIPPKPTIVPGINGGLPLGIAISRIYLTNIDNQ